MGAGGMVAGGRLSSQLLIDSHPRVFNLNRAMGRAVGRISVLAVAATSATAATTAASPASATTTAATTATTDTTTTTAAATTAAPPAGADAMAAAHVELSFSILVYFGVHAYHLMQ